MVGQAVVLLAAALEHLAPLAREGADDVLGAPLIGGVAAVEHEELLAVADVLRIGHRQRRLAHREVVNRIDHIGLARAVVAHEAIDAGRELELLLRDILKVDD